MYSWQIKAKLSIYGENLQKLWLWVEIRSNGSDCLHSTIIFIKIIRIRFSYKNMIRWSHTNVGMGKIKPTIKYCWYLISPFVLMEIVGIMALAIYELCKLECITHYAFILIFREKSYVWRPDIPKIWMNKKPWVYGGASWCFTHLVLDFAVFESLKKFNLYCTGKA